MDRDDRSCFWILDFKVTFCQSELKPVVSVELRDQIAGFVDQCKLFGVTRKHALVNVDLELLLFLGSLICIEHDVVD